MNRKMLDNVLNEFIELHWNKDDSSLVIPIWTHYDGQEEVPFKNAAGCYVMVSGSELAYVGSCLGQGGISKRIRDYLKPSTLNNRKYEFKWYDSVYLIAFDPKISYLAAAFEFFLINRLSNDAPLRNKRKMRIKNE